MSHLTKSKSRNQKPGPKKAESGSVTRRIVERYQNDAGPFLVVDGSMQVRKGVRRRTCFTVQTNSRRADFDYHGSTLD
jgi:hypothetical protein